MTPESSMSTPDAPLTTERLDAEVEQIRRHYGDRRGLYDAGQMVAHLDILLAAHARLTAELAEARQFVTRVHQRIQAWSDDPQTRLEAFAITHEQVADLKAEVLKRGQQNTELARLHAEACRKLEQAEAALTELAPLKPAASDAARQLLMGAIAEHELHTGLRPALLAAWRSLKAADVALSPTMQAEPAHPESACGRCGLAFVPWSAPSPLWNEVMRGGDILNGEILGGIVCASCFIAVADEAGIGERWGVIARKVNRELQVVTPSGRVWNADAWLWGDPTVHAEEMAECGWDDCSEPATAWGVCVEHFDTKEQHPLVTARHARGVNCDLPRPCELHDVAPIAAQARCDQCGRTTCAGDCGPYACSEPSPIGAFGSQSWCETVEGHEGDHRDGDYFWPQAIPVVAEATRAEPSKGRRHPFDGCGREHTYRAYCEYAPAAVADGGAA